MSPAEITQQLGLQSLTRRAWVSDLLFIDGPLYLCCSSSSNPPALLLVTVCTKVSSGFPML